MCVIILLSGSSVYASMCVNGSTRGHELPPGQRVSVGGLKRERFMLYSWCIFTLHRKKLCMRNKINTGCSCSVGSGGGVFQMLAIGRKSFYSGCHGNRERERK